jgi:hypothetical protein
MSEFWHDYTLSPDEAAAAIESVTYEAFDATGILIDRAVFAGNAQQVTDFGDAMLQLTDADRVIGTCTKYIERWGDDAPSGWTWTQRFH